jgi:sulfur carrier protein ThiS adenylyltransferase
MKIEDVEGHLGRYRVGIAGAGGLGSNCAVALARAGIGTLVIVDYDLVEESNLSRQNFFRDQIGMTKTGAIKENILRINSGINVVTVNEKLNFSNIPEIFTGCDIIVEAFDTAETKRMLVEAVNDQMPGIPLVIGSGLAGWGNNENIRYRKIDDFLFVCGDESTEVTDDMPPLAPRVGIVANMQANVVVEILMKRFESDKRNENFTE